MDSTQVRRAKRAKARARRARRQDVIFILIVILVAVMVGKVIFEDSTMSFDEKLADTKTTVKWEEVNARQDILGGLTSIAKEELPEGTEVLLTGNFWGGTLQDKEVQIEYKGELYTVPLEALDY